MKEVRCNPLSASFARRTHPQAPVHHPPDGIALVNGNPPSESEMKNETIVTFAQGCPLCNCEDRKVVRSEPEGQLFRCRRCRFLYVYPRPTLDELKALYDAEYFSDRDLESWLSCRTPVYRQCLQHLDKIAPGGGRLLDVGCGTGEFVAQALSHGWSAVGIESSNVASQFAREHNHVPVHNVVLETAPFAPGSFDVVTLLDVLEHLLDPQAEITRVHRLIKPGGMAVVRVPNTLFHLPKARMCALLKVSDSNLEIPHHLNHFTPPTLSRLLRTVGFEVLSVEIGAPETKAHAAWASPKAKRLYVRGARLLQALAGLNLGNIMVAYARKAS
jgi:SAM-dependent methyltransferase